MWLKIGGFALVAGLLGLLIWLYGGARYNAGRLVERTFWQDEVAKAERAKLAAYRDGVASVMDADVRYIETVREKVVPVTQKIIERATAYAATPEGSAMCLSPDRVGLLAETRSALFIAAPAAPAGGADAALPADSEGN